MKIALLSEKYTPDLGGLAISADRLARLLSSAGHELSIFAPTVNLRVSETRTLSSNGISITRFGVHKRVDDTLVDWFELIVEEHNHAPFYALHAYFPASSRICCCLRWKSTQTYPVLSARAGITSSAPCSIQPAFRM